jgi:hypothetical protein
MPCESSTSRKNVTSFTGEVFPSWQTFARLQLETKTGVWELIDDGLGVTIHVRGCRGGYGVFLFVSYESLNKLKPTSRVGEYLAPVQHALLVAGAVRSTASHPLPR